MQSTFSKNSRAAIGRQPSRQAVVTSAVFAALATSGLAAVVALSLGASSTGTWIAAGIALVVGGIASWVSNS